MGKPELVTDTRYSTHDARAGRLPEINGIVSDWVRSLTAQEACARLDAGQQPYSLIYTIEEIAKDPHYEARGSIATLDHPRLGPLKMQGVAPRLLGTPAPAIRPAPELGEATEHVLLNLLGKSITEVERLRAAGVV
jgi:formyl-CoA transferase